VTGAKRAAIVGICCLTVFMIAVDTTVVKLALPLIGRGLHTRPDGGPAMRGSAARTDSAQPNRGGRFSRSEASPSWTSSPMNVSIS
jgi:hypothetical protein